MKNVIIIVLGTTLLAAGLLAQEATPASAPAGNDWPRWRGPDANGIVADKDWSAANAKQLWKIDIGPGFSVPSVVAGKVYVMGSSKGKEIVYCLKIEDGSKLWEYPYDCSDVQYPGPRSAPTVDGKHIFTFGAKGDVTCLDLEGKKVWAKNIAKELGMKVPMWGFAGSPLVEGKLLILNAGDSGVALNKEDGSVAWKSGAGPAGYATPVLFKYKGKDALAIFSGKAVYAVAPADGKVLWKFPWSTSYDVNAADPLPIAPDKLFLTSGYSTGCGLIDISGAEPKQLWQNKEMLGQFSSAVYLDGYIYGCNGNVGKTTVVCLDVKDGTSKWSYPAGAMSGLILADGQLIVNTAEGKLLIGKASPEKFEPTTITTTAKEIWSAPVLAEGKIFVRGQKGDLACVEAKK